MEVFFGSESVDDTARYHRVEARVIRIILHLDVRCLNVLLHLWIRRDIAAIVQSSVRTDHSGKVQSCCRIAVENHTRLKWKQKMPLPAFFAEVPNTVSPPHGKHRRSPPEVHGPGSLNRAGR